MKIETRVDVIYHNCVVVYTSVANIYDTRFTSSVHDDGDEDDSDHSNS